MTPHESRVAIAIVYVVFSYILMGYMIRWQSKQDAMRGERYDKDFCIMLGAIWILSPFFCLLFSLTRIAGYAGSVLSVKWHKKRSEDDDS